MKKPITILVANPFNQASSGNDEVFTRLMANIDREHFKFIVAQPGESLYSDIYRRLGAVVETMPMSLIRRDLSVGYLARYFAGFLPTIFRFMSLIRKYSIDIVHTNTTQVLGAGAAARLCRRPSIYHAHSVSIQKPEWVGRLLTEWIKLTGDILISNSRASGESFVRRGFPGERFVPLGNPVDLKDYNQQDARGGIRNEFPTIGNAPLIGLVGRIARVKSIEHFIEAASIVAQDFKEARFIIVGAPGHIDPDDAAYLDELKLRVGTLSLNDKLIFSGRRNDIPSVMASLDALALTSSSEGFGLVLIEAMAAGTPVIGSNVGGVPEVITDGENGILVPYGDHRAIAAAMRTLITNRDLARKMGISGRQKVERFFAADRLAKELEAIYLSLVARK